MDKFKTLRKLLMSNGSIVVNKALASALGMETAIMYSELLSKADYFETNNQLGEDGSFFNTVENMEGDTTLSEYQQRKAIKKLIEFNLIKCKVRGLPAKRYFIINEDSELIFNLLQNNFLKNCGTDTEKTKELESEKLQGNNTNLNNNKVNNPNNNKDILSSKELDLITPIKYLNEKTGRNFSPSCKGTIRLIKARYNEGRTLEDFKRVIDKKCKDWLNDAKMKIYLRPSTLFSETNFENYINEPDETYYALKDWRGFEDYVNEPNKRRG